MQSENKTLQINTIYCHFDKDSPLSVVAGKRPKSVVISESKANS